MLDVRGAAPLMSTFRWNLSNRRTRTAHDSVALAMIAIQGE